MEWHRHVPMTVSEVEELAERLLPLGGSVGMEEESAGPGHADTRAAVVGISAKSLLMAVTVTAAVVEVERITGCVATGVELLPEAEHQRRTSKPTIPELVGFTEIAKMAGVTKQRGQQMPNIAGFPMAVVVTAAGPLRVKSQVEAFLRTWERKPRAPTEGAICLTRRCPLVAVADGGGASGETVSLGEATNAARVDHPQRRLMSARAVRSREPCHSIEVGSRLTLDCSV